MEFMLEAKNYFIKPGYQPRLDNLYYHDETSGITYQPDVYPFAAGIARLLGRSTIVDVGCGHGQKLAANYPEFQIVGIDYGPNIQWCREHYLFGDWIEYDIEHPSTIPPLPPAVVICSDVIEHLRDPDHLLALLRKLATPVILSTPDRSRLPGVTNGPPFNQAHVREWTLGELSAYIAASGFSIYLSTNTRSEDQSSVLATSLLLIEPNVTVNGRSER
jgi:SAM-dependent methyltransferase